MYTEKLIVFEARDKEYMISSADIEEGIRELCDAINSIPCLMTMNSCQGKVYGDEENHCPKTYVDFYVLDENYEIADNLMILLSSELVDDYASNEVQLNVRFEQDHIRSDNNVGWEYTNLVRKRYSIGFYDEELVNTTDKEMLEHLRGYIRNRVRKATQLVKMYRNKIS